MAQHSAWFPEDLNIQPFTANFLEPKLGFAFHNGSDNLRLDISNSRDIYRWYDLTNSRGIDRIYENGIYKSDIPIDSNEYLNKEFSIGADLFTYTRLRREDEFHFPVETIDYLFGLNAGYKVIVREILPSRFYKIPVNHDSMEVAGSCQGKIYYEYGIRFRLSHISAHLVDGKYDYKIDNWRDGDKPRVFSKEFIELFPYFKIHDLRVYAGLTYLFHVTPKEIGKDAYQIGFDYFIGGEGNIFYPFLPFDIKPFVAYDFKLNHIDKYSGNNIITIGIKFTSWTGNARGSGCSLQYSYMSGKSIHGEYFDRNENYSTIGFNIDL